MRAQLTRWHLPVPRLVTLWRYLRRQGVVHQRLPPAPFHPPSRARRQQQPRYAPVHRRQRTPKAYPTDFSPAEWDLLRPFFEKKAGGRGRPSPHGEQRLLEAIHYVLRSGCPWRLLPHDFPPWETVYAAFRRWHAKGLFEKAHDLLRERWRVREGRGPKPTAAILDTQSVKTAEKGAPGAMTEGKK
jgi:transposase